jgi:hypothetical protein
LCHSHGNFDRLHGLHASRLNGHLSHSHGILQPVHKLKHSFHTPAIAAIPTATANNLTTNPSIPFPHQVWWPITRQRLAIAMAFTTDRTAIADGHANGQVAGGVV